MIIIIIGTKHGTWNPGKLSHFHTFCMQLSIFFSFRSSFFFSFFTCDKLYTVWMKISTWAIVIYTSEHLCIPLRISRFFTCELTCNFPLKPIYFFKYVNYIRLYVIGFFRVDNFHMWKKKNTAMKSREISLFTCESQILANFCFQLAVISRVLKSEQVRII